MPDETEPPKVIHINTFSTAGQRAPNQVGQPLPDWIQTVGRRKRMSTKARLGLAGAAGAAGAASLLVGASAFDAMSHHSPTVSTEGHVLIQVLGERDFVPGHSRATEFETGEIDIRFGASIREAPILTEKHDPGTRNKIELSEIAAIDGVNVKDLIPLKGFTLRNAKLLTNGEDVDGDGRGKTWIELDILKTNGERLFGYVSKSNTMEKDHLVVSRPLRRERIVKDARGNILLPSGGFNIITHLAKP